MAFRLPCRHRCKPRFYFLLLLFLTLTFFIRIHPSSGELPSESRFIQFPTWRATPSPQWFPPSLESSNYRAFVSSLPKNSTNGLGHRVAIINYELYMSMLLNVSYIHRVSRYGSLSPDEDPYAVERLFGWLDYPHLRHNFLKEHCKEEKFLYAENCGDNWLKPPTYPVCTKLKEGSSFKRVLHIPNYLSKCLRFPDLSKEQCKRDIIKFGSENGEEGTLFVLGNSMCSSEFREGDFTETGAWFREMYWGFHKNKTGNNREKEGLTRILGFEEGRVEVAVHVRRGDFIVYKDRVMVGDGVYADVVKEVAKATRNVFGVRARVGVTIFSEGVGNRGRIRRDDHNVGNMMKIYVDENGKWHGKGEGHWRRLLRRRGVAWVELKMRIAHDTVESLHEMMCADVFIGSRSGLSMQLVSAMGRGMMLLPGKGNKGWSENGDWKLRFDYDKIYFQEDVIEKGLRALVGTLG